MKPTREESLFALALEKSATERAAFLDRECQGDLRLRARLDALLRAHENPDSLFASQSQVTRTTVGLNISEEFSNDAIGQTIGRYKLLEKVGEGGCGVVYVAEQTEPVRRRVALKVIKLGMDTKAVVARFEAERQALAMMDHPNIAKVLDAGTTDKGRPYFVMELVRGIRITDYCDQNQLATRERLELFIRVCHAIQHAHQKGIIHRDIKPSNILVTLHDGVPVPKVIDFGIAKATEGRLTDATVYTQLHQFIGTPAYMSPEQAEMSGLDVDTRSDIYSLGVLLYELLTGKTPFDGQELMASGIDGMRKTIREREPIRPSTRLAAMEGEELTTAAKRRSLEAPKLVHLLQGDLDWIVMKALEKDRTRRYETANGLGADIQRHLSNDPVLARPPSAAYKLQKAIRRNKLAFAASAAVLIALLAGITVSTWKTFEAWEAQRDAETARVGERTQRIEAEEARKTAEAERERANLEANKASSSERQLRRLLYASDIGLTEQALKVNNLGRARELLNRHRPKDGEEDLRGWEWRYLWQLTRGSSRVTLTNRIMSGTTVSVSPDGTKLAAGWSDGQIELWDVPAKKHLRSLVVGESIELITSRRKQVARVAFSPVDNVVAATAELGVVHLFDLDSGKESEIWKLPDHRSWNVRELSFAKDGSKLVIYAGELNNSRDAVWVVDAASGRIENHYTVPATGSDHHGSALLSPDSKVLYLGNCSFEGSQYFIQCLELATGKERWRTKLERDYGLTCLAISSDGRFLASGSGFEDSSIRVWDAQTGKFIVQLNGHSSWVSRLVFTQDGRKLVSASSDQTIRSWETETWKEDDVLRGHVDEVCKVALAEARKLIASISRDGDLTLWNWDGEKASSPGSYLFPEEIQQGQIHLLQNSTTLLFPPKGTPRLVEVSRRFDSQSVEGAEGAAELIEFFPPNTMCRWNGTNEILIDELAGSKLAPVCKIATDPGQRPMKVAYNSRLRLFAWHSPLSPNSVLLANVTAPNRRIEIKSDVPLNVPMLFSENGEHLITASGHSQTNFAMRIWKVDTGQVVLTVNRPSAHGVFALNDKVLVLALSGQTGHEIGFYDLDQPEQPPKFVSGALPPRSLVVSPDGTMVASTVTGGPVRLYDVAKGELVAILSGQISGYHSADFSPDGRRLIAGAGGGMGGELWDLGTHQKLLTFDGVGSFLNVAQWSKDGDTIMLGRPIQFWRAPSWEEIAATEEKEGAR